MIRRGYISVYALIVMSILLLTIYYFVYTTHLESLILKRTNDNIQSYYLAEGKIQMALYDKYYDEELHPYLLKTFRDTKISQKDITLDPVDLDKSDSFSNVSISLNVATTPFELYLSTQSDYNGVKTRVTATCTIFNDFFEMGKPILNPSNVDDGQKVDFYKLLNNIYDQINLDYNDLPSETYGGQFSNFEKISVNQTSENTFTLSAFRETMDEPYIEYIGNNNLILIINKFGEKEVELILGNDEVKQGEDEASTMILNGLIFVEGNITIFNKFTFNGIIILKDGDIVVEADDKPTINGLIISSNDIIAENIHISYDFSKIYKYGTYIPGFIDPKLLLIKNYE